MVLRLPENKYFLSFGDLSDAPMAHTRFFFGRGSTVKIFLATYFEYLFYFVNSYEFVLKLFSALFMIVMDSMTMF